MHIELWKRRSAHAEKAEMLNQITISKTLGIRECGLDELWLQDQIAKDPSILGLGELELVKREKSQSSGGRLDVLLADTDDGSMYEIEVMLGATDETHIIRTIEYWDLEKRRYPQRQHTAVLVAEKITRRFFNVIQLLSLSIPIIAIQASIVEGEGQKMLHFTTVLDVYEEPDITMATPEGSSEETWQREAPGVVESAKKLLALQTAIFQGLNLKFVKNYISLRVGNTIYWWLKRRVGGSLIHFWLDENAWFEAKTLLEQHGVAYTFKQGRGWGLILGNAQLIESKAELFRKLGELIKQSYDRS
jgi:hypothetical protein